jgi:hypothetical protein
MIDNAFNNLLETFIKPLLLEKRDKAKALKRSSSNKQTTEQQIMAMSGALLKVANAVDGLPSLFAPKPGAPEDEEEDEEPTG